MLRVSAASGARRWTIWTDLAARLLSRCCHGGWERTSHCDSFPGELSQRGPEMLTKTLSSGRRSAAATASFWEREGHLRRFDPEEANAQVAIRVDDDLVTVVDLLLDRAAVLAVLAEGCLSDREAALRLVDRLRQTALTLRATVSG